ncbi:MAG: AMP-binding protein, partial [Cyclobacteriaceae bacterium]
MLTLSGKILSEEVEPTRLFDILEYQATHLPQPDCLAAKVDGRWVTYSTQDTMDIVNQFSLGLLKSGIKKDDKIAIISFNRPEWVWIDLAIQQLGAVSVPMYPNITVADYEYIFKDAGVSMVFVGNEDLFGKVREATKDLDEVKSIYSFDRLEGVEHWSKLQDLARGEDPGQLQSFKKKVLPEDLVTII